MLFLNVFDDFIKVDNIMNTIIMNIDDYYN